METTLRIEALIKQREDFRSSKDFVSADKIMQMLVEYDIVCSDNADGKSTWKYKQESLSINQDKPEKLITSDSLNGRKRHQRQKLCRRRTVKNRGRDFAYWLIDNFSHEILSKRTILDIAGGKGNVSYYLCSFGFSCIVVDPCPIRFSAGKSKQILRHCTVTPNNYFMSCGISSVMFNTYVNKYIISFKSDYEKIIWIAALSRALFLKEQITTCNSNSNSNLLCTERLNQEMKTYFTLVVKSILSDRSSSRDTCMPRAEELCVPWLDQGVVADTLYHVLTQDVPGTIPVPAIPPASNLDEDKTVQDGGVDLRIDGQEGLWCHQACGDAPPRERLTLLVTVSNAEELLVQIVTDILNQIDDALRGTTKMRYAPPIAPMIASAEAPSDFELNELPISCTTNALALTHYAIYFAPSSTCSICEKLLNDASVVIGFHPDQATESIVDEALRYSLPFAVVPCCVFPDLSPHRVGSDGKHVRSFGQFIDYLQAKHIRMRKSLLENIWGPNNIVLYMTLEDYLA